MYIPVQNSKETSTIRSYLSYTYKEMIMEIATKSINYSFYVTESWIGRNELL